MNVTKEKSKLRTINITEAYNAESGLWEECEREKPEREKLTPEHIQKQISDVEEKIKNISYDFEVLYNFVEGFSLHVEMERLRKEMRKDNEKEKENEFLTGANLSFLGRIFKDKSEALYNAGEILEILELHIEVFGINS